MHNREQKLLGQVIPFFSDPLTSKMGPRYSLSEVVSGAVSTRVPEAVSLSEAREGDVLRA